MVKVAKIAVWDVDGQLIRDFKAAEQATRAIVIEELLAEANPLLNTQEAVAGWVSSNWDDITSRVEKAMAGT